MAQVHPAATVGDLEKLIADLKGRGEITSETRLSAIDVDGTTQGKGPVEVRVFNPNESGIGDHMLAIWGDYSY